MVRQRKPGKSDPEDLKITGIRPADKPQRHHGAVIQLPVPFTERACRKALLFRQYADHIPKLPVIAFIKPDFGSAETGKGAGCPLSGRDMKIIRVHDAVGTCDDNGLRLEHGDLRRDLFISPGRFFDFGFASPSHRGHDHGRMRDHKCGKQ